MPKCPSNTIFNNHGGLRAVNQKEIHYFDALECESYEHIYNLIVTCVEFHDNTPSDNHNNKKICSCN